MDEGENEAPSSRDSVPELALDEVVMEEKPVEAGS